MLIKINIQIFVLCILLILSGQIKTYMWIMLFALIHEFAHMFTGLLLRLKPKTMKIEPFGISIIFEDFGCSRKNRIIIALAGPIMNFIIVFVFCFIHVKAQMLIINSNILLALFNLLPIYPLDGGRIIREAFKDHKNEKEIQRTVNTISNVLVTILTFINSILVIIFKNLGLFLITIYLWTIIMRENRRYLLERKIYNLIEISK